MGYLFFEYLKSHDLLEGPLSFLRLLSYISFRASFAFLTAFLISLVFGRRIILSLYKKGVRESKREIIDTMIQDKKGTPTMGGLLIILAVITSSLIWCDLQNLFVVLCLASIVWFGTIGLIDDRRKLLQQSSDVGLSRTKKLLLQGIFGLFLGLVIFSEPFSPFPSDMIHNLYIPFYKNPLINLSWFYLPFCIFIILSISNAVNFADGLDGLAIVPASTTIAVYGIFAYIISNAIYSDYLLYDTIPGTGELTILCAGVIGAGLGFLWYNAYPAQVFMGDTGSQALGGLIATIALLIKQEFLFLIAGGIFLAEAVSVLVQDRVGIAHIGRRLLYRAPLHHTFQHRGIAEPTVVVRFWIISIILALMSLVTLKIR